MPILLKQNSPRKQPARRWTEYLIAILAGNIVYFFLEPRLPSQLQHQTFRVDLGLALDFGLCVAIYGLLRLVGSLVR